MAGAQLSPNPRVRYARLLLMKVLALNCGSSSVRCHLFETGTKAIEEGSERRLGGVLVDRVGENNASLRYETETGNAEWTRPVADHREAIELAVEALLERLGSRVLRRQEIAAAGHRVVHGGDRFQAPVELDERVACEIEEWNDLAPLHNPHNLTGYRAAREVLPQARHVAVFDTAFHQSMEPRAYLYGLPDSLWRRWRVRRYGFHGSSHRYVAWRFAELHGDTKKDYRLITCHLGNGCSMTAVRNGKSVDTSMGFTPLEGLLMGTRCGDLDAGAVLYLMAKENFTVEQMDHLLNRQSGLYGLSMASNDMRTLLDLRRRGHSAAAQAVEVFCYRVKKYIGAYYAVLNGCDGVIFTGGIGENSPAVRAEICRGLEALGIELDPDRNEKAVGKEMYIGGEAAKVELWVIPTDEALVIARDTVRYLEGAG